MGILTDEEKQDYAYRAGAKDADRYKNALEEIVGGFGDNLSVILKESGSSELTPADIKDFLNDFDAVDVQEMLANVLYNAHTALK